MKQKLSVASFPVVFHDGEHESNIGEISIHPSMDFKLFQSILSQTIGISPHQFTVYRVNQKKDSSLWSETLRRSPITAKANFAVIVRDKDCFFLVVLKRSRRDRRRKNNYSNHDFRENNYYDDVYDHPAHVYDHQLMRFEQQYVHPGVVLLRRDTDMDNLHFNRFEASSPYYDTVSTSDYLADYNSRRVDYYNECMKINGFSYNNVQVCENCRDAAKKGLLPEFHCCFYDPVVPAFKPSSGGVIARPVKVKDSQDIQ